jgi:hypothetical protein
MKDIQKYSKYLIPLLTAYLLLLSYNPKLFKFFGNDYCQLIMVVGIITLYYWNPSIAWVCGVVFLITYRCYHETQFIKEAFSQQFPLPSQPTENDVKDEIKHKLTEEEDSVIQTIQKKYSDSIDFLLEDDIEKINKYTCVSHEEGVGLPTPVREYDLSKVIDFDF